MSTVTWLHISDLHWRELGAYDANVVAKALLRDLANRAQIAPVLTKIDLIFVTGDIAFASQPEEYGLARQFFTDLSRTTGVRKSRLFVIPGNHDVDRVAISDDARDTVNMLSSRQAVNRLLDDEVGRATVMQRFHRYRQFVNGYLGRYLPFDSALHFYMKRRKIAGKRVAILGLNSAWASASDADRHNLFLGERQVRAALEQAKRADIRIALVHHPFEWLREFDRDDCEPLLLRGCDFVLHGHLHRTGVMRLQAPGSEAMVIGAGACYDTREYPNAYNLVHLDFSSGKGTVYLRMYSDRQGGFWTKDLLTYQDASGEYVVDLPRDWIIARVEKPVQQESIESRLELAKDIRCQAKWPEEGMPRVEFGADGIRGVAGEWPLLPHVAVRIGEALGQFVRGRSEHPFIVIGRDTRPSGADLLPCLAAGLTGQGVDVINPGVMATPGVGFLARRLRADLGVIVSGSDDPPEYNGIKLVGPNGLRLQREEEIEIESLISELVHRTVGYATTPGQQTDGQHLIELYIQDHVKRCPAESLEGLKVVLDCANGATSRVAPEAFRRLGAEVVVINDAVEGKSINYRCGSEYTREHPQDLVEVVRRHDAAYGFALDGDGDRLVVVDPDSRVFDGNHLLFVLGMYFRSQRLLRGDAVVTTRLANRGFEEALSRAGIRTVYTGNGDKNLEAAMWGGDYLLGGEPGGNIIINDGHHTAADAVYTALVLGGVLVRMVHKETAARYESALSALSGIPVLTPWSSE